MMRSQIDIVCILSVAVAAACHAGESQTRLRSVSILQAQDNACGPKCLWALTQLTGVGNADVNDIYRIIGRPVTSAVNLKDLKDAAVKLGFAAEGCKLKPSDLTGLRGYAILPVGKTTGTEQEPLHFVLIAGAKGEEIAVIDTTALALEVVPMAALTKIWAGPALVISRDTQGNQLSKPLAPLDGAQATGRQIIDLGTVEVGTKINRSLVVSSADDRTEWKIIGKSCHCLEAELSRDAAGRVVLSAHLEVKMGGSQVQFIAVSSQQASVRKDYQFRVFGKNAHRIRPDNAYLDAREGRTEYPIIIQYFPGDTNGSVTFDGVQTTIANLECGEPNIVETTYGDARAVTISVPLIYTLTDAARGKTFKEDILFKLKTGGGDRLLSFPLTIKAGEALLKVTPETLLFLCPKASASAVRKTLHVTLSAKTTASELSARPEGGVQLDAACHSLGAGEYAVDVCIPPAAIADLSPGIYRGRLTLALAGSEPPLQAVVPVTVAVRE
jgi:predicted double-glycine peptidase